MSIPLQVTFRGIPRSEAVHAQVQKLAERLERFHGQVTRCHVTVELPHARHQHGNRFAVQVDLHVPGGDITVSRDPSADRAHEDLSVTIRDAFSAATRRLEDQARRSRGDVKQHSQP